MEQDGVRLNKYLSDMGICSRREADRMTGSGRVAVDGEKAVMGMRILPGQIVSIDGKPIEPDGEKVLLAFYKPRGIVCTTSKKEPDNIIDFIHYGRRIYPIGRLDKDSEGLILLTNQGEFSDQILRGSHYHEKEYLVRVNKKVTGEFLKGLSAGVPILDTVTRPCQAEKIDDYKFCIILTQGLNRQIRRMCEYFGYRVVNLKRVRIMNITLGRLKSGTYREVTKEEQNEMFRLCR